MKSKYRRWTEEEDELLKSLYQEKSLKELGKLFNRGDTKICRRAIILGIKKSKESISKHLSIAIKKQKWRKVRYRGSGNPNYKRGYRFNNGYKLLLINGKYVREHRKIYEDNHTCCLLKGTIVHHKDENKLNNKINNLEAMSISEHMKLHSRRRYGK